MLFRVASFDSHGEFAETDDVSEIFHGTLHEETLLQLDGHPGLVQEIKDSIDMGEVRVHG